MKNIGDETFIRITRQESNFDRACDSAYKYALAYFEIDEDGHSRRVKDWERSCCWIEIEFRSYIRMGNEHHYDFFGRAVKEDE